MIQIFNSCIYKYRMLLIPTFIYKYVYVCVCVFYISNPTSAIHLQYKFTTPEMKIQGKFIMGIPL